jgi:hypothetical protein
MNYDLFCFENSGGDLIVDLLKFSKNLHLLDNVFLNPNTVNFWQQSKNKKIVSVVDLETQIKLSIKNKNWFFKYYNENIFFNNLLVRLLKSETNNQSLVLITTIEELVNLSDRDLKKKILKKYSGAIKKIIKKDFSMIYDTFAPRFSYNDNGQLLFNGYKNSTDLSNADVVINLNKLIESNGKILFDKLSIEYKNDYQEVVNSWKKINLQ